MSVYVKVSGMEMPTCCRDCDFVSVGMEWFYCTAPGQHNKAMEFGMEEIMPDDCPLVEVKTPHG